jgi:hypothetical protein
MTDRADVRRTAGSGGRAGKEPEVAELHSQLAKQAEAIEELRREVEWLTEELASRDTESADQPAAGATDEDGDALSRRLSRDLRRLVHERVPQRSRLVVAGGGDDAFLRFPNRGAEHLSQDRSGGYKGSPPSCSRAAVVQLEAARWRGADVLVIPKPDLWWLQHYPQLAEHLETRYRLVAREDDIGAIWDLRSPHPSREAHDLLAELCLALGHQPAILDWNTGQDLAALFNGYKVFSPVGDTLPYLEHTIDVVAVKDPSAEAVTQARRVAKALVICVRPGSPPAMEVLWQSELGRERSMSVSIAVVSRDGRPSTPNYVRYLLETLPWSFAGEVIVDRACDPLFTPQIGPETPRLKRVKLIDCRNADSFAARARRCAEAASGDVLVVLDGRTWPVTNWLPPLVHLLRTIDDAGVVGGMLVEPDGRLAPGTVSGDARDDDLEAIRHTYVRALDAAPDGLFVTHRQLFLEQDHAPDDPVAFYANVRSSGMRVLYQPETVAIASWPDADPPAEMGSIDD